jgi:serine/threonine-protein kinase
LDRLGEYELLERLGVGGMAEVFRARLTRAEGFEKTVVVKRILPHLTRDPEFVRMFIAEAKLAAQLIHANIVQVSDFGSLDGQLYIVMDFVDGLNLRQVQDAGPVGVAEAVLIASEVANALVFASSQAVVHRDVSPQNILLSRHGEVKLSDFGIAKAADSSLGNTATGTLKGKIQYMAPEQLRGEPVDARSDIFSLGVVLWELLAGRVLFSGPTELGILERRKAGWPLDRPSKYNSEVPPGLDQVVLKSLEDRPDRRFSTASELAGALERAQQALLLDRPRVELLADLCRSRQSPTFRTSVMGSTPAVPSTPAIKKPPRRTTAALLVLLVASVVAAIAVQGQLEVPGIRPPGLPEGPQLQDLDSPPLGPAMEAFLAQPETQPAPSPPLPSRPAARSLPGSAPRTGAGAAEATGKKGLPASVFQPGVVRIPEATDRTAAAEAYGTVFIDSEPRAEVTQKDLSLGMTPIQKRVPPGEHTFVLGAVGSLEFVDVSIRAGEVLRMLYKLDGKRWIRVLNTRERQVP